MYWNMRIGLLVTILTLCLVSCDEDKDKNSLWRKNDVIMRTTNEYYFSLAVKTTDANLRSKRFWSVFSEAILYHAASNAPNKVKRVQEAVRKTRKQLDKPADAIGGQMRTLLSILRTAIDQPMNDVKISCKPHTKEAECREKLRRFHEINRKACREYDRNLHLYEKVRDLANDPQYASFAEEAKDISDNSDEVALSYFTNIALVKYPSLVQKGRNLIRLRANTTYSCDIGNLPLY